MSSASRIWSSLVSLVSRRDAPWRLRWSGLVFGPARGQVLVNVLAVAGFAGSLAGREWAASRAAPAPA